MLKLSHQENLVYKTYLVSSTPNSIILLIHSNIIFLLFQYLNGTSLTIIFSDLFIKNWSTISKTNFQYSYTNRFEVSYRVKVYVCYIFASLLLSLKENFSETRKISFISLQELFSFLRKSNFGILHIQISWRHQMPKHKTRNTF